MSERAAAAVGGALGALVRGGLLLAVAATGAVLADLLVIVGCNLLGTFGLGWLVGRAERVPRWADRATLLGTGVAGALTTFSGLTLLLVGVAERWGWGIAIGVAVGHVGLGLMAARSGLRGGRG